MYADKTKRNIVTLLVVACLIVLCLTIILNSKNFITTNADSLNTEYIAIDSEFNGFVNIGLFAADKKDKDEPDGIINIAGPEKGNVHRPISEFTNVQYIENSNYFLLNPKHRDNDGSDVEKGSCTTVAMQMLMGYHNYYSDRRLIPEVSISGTRFLDGNYGDLNSHPAFERDYAKEQGCEKIGTEDTVYDELMNLNFWEGWGTVSQMGGVVKDAAREFVKKHASGIKDNVSITFKDYNKSTAKADIDAGSPIILIVDGWDLDFYFHVVTAYGYATLDGVDGFIVHFGFGDYRRHAWMPASFFRYQIRMSVDHTHNFVNNGEFLNKAYKGLICVTCKATTVDDLYDVKDGAITKVEVLINGSIVIPAKIKDTIITAIGNGAFAYQTNLTCVTIEDGSQIEKIGNSAFYDCRKLKEIDLYLDKLKVIDTAAFAYCSSLEKVNILELVETIGDSAFKGCSKLKEIAFTYNKNIKSIGNSAFLGCSSLNNFNPTTTLESIGDSAFYGCGSLSSIGDISNVKSIGDSAFRNCLNLEYFSIPQEVTNIGRYTFYGCISLIDIGDSRNVLCIGDYAFYNCSSLKGLLFGSLIKYWALSTDKTQSYNWNTPITGAITLIAVWEKLTYNFTLINNGTEYEVSKGTMDPNGIVVIPATYNDLPVTRIANSAFYGSNLTTITIPASITTIGKDAFYGCTNLKNITFEDGSFLTDIGDNAFYSCKSLAEISVPKGVIAVGNKAFANTGLSKILITDETANIAADAFEGTEITSIVKWIGLSANGISAAVTTNELTLTFDKELIGLDIFSNITLSRATIRALSSSGFNYTISIFDLITGNEGIVTVSLTAPTGVALIGGTKGATTFDATIYTANLEFSLIDDGTAYEVLVGDALAEDNTIIVIPPVYNGLLVTKIADGGFSDCIGLTGIIVPPSVKIIGNSAFSDCIGLTSVSLPNSLVIIGDSAFSGCTGLTSVFLADSLISIGESAFYNCTALTSVKLPYNLTGIGYSAFYNCTGLTEITIPYGTTYVGGYAFFGCTGLTSIDLPSSLTVIEFASFAGCTGLTSIIIPEGVTRIGSLAFMDCINLTDVSIPATLMSVGTLPFYGCIFVPEYPLYVISFG